MVVLELIERETLQVFLHISQMLNVCTFGNTADIYATVPLVPHTHQHITVNQSHSSGDTVLPKVDTLSICKICKKTWRVSLSIGEELP